MTGFLGFAPIYVNGLLAIFFVCVLPGLVLVRAFDIPDFPQRWFVIFLSSLTANHFLVTLIATLHLDPLTTYRIVTTVLIALLIFATVRKAAGSGNPVYRDRSVVLLSDIGWLLLSLVVISLRLLQRLETRRPQCIPGQRRRRQLERLVADLVCRE